MSNILNVLLLSLILIFTSCNIHPTNVDMIKRSAEKGNVAAQMKLGYMYEFGKEGVSVNYKESLKWYIMAAQSGEREPLYLLGLTYNTGRIVPKDEKKAYEYLIQAAQKNEKNAQALIALYYFEGIVVEKNKMTGCFWLYVAAENGNENARIILPDLLKQLSFYEKKQIVQAADEWMSRGN